MPGNRRSLTTQWKSPLAVTAVAAVPTLARAIPLDGLLPRGLLHHVVRGRLVHCGQQASARRVKRLRGRRVILLFLLLFRASHSVSASVHRVSAAKSMGSVLSRRPPLPPVCRTGRSLR